MASEHLTKDDQTCVHGVHVREACAYCQQEGKGRPTSNERTQQLRYPDAWGDTALLKRNAKWAADELDRQRAEVERLTRERDHFQACWNAVSDIRADRDRLMKLLEIERGVVLTRGQALTRALRCFDELLDNVWPNGLPSTVDAVVEQMRRALENGKRPPSETAGDWLTNEQCDDVIAFLEDYEWTGLTRENVRTWCTAIAEARSSVNGKGGHE